MGRRREKGRVSLTDLKRVPGVTDCWERRGANVGRSEPRDVRRLSEIGPAESLVWFTSKKTGKETVVML